MKKNTLISIVFIAVSVGLAVLSFIILPETVIMQISAGSGDNSTAPKVLAILLPTALGIGGAVFNMLLKNNEKANGKCLVVSAVGIILFIVMIIVNTAGTVS